MYEVECVVVGAGVVGLAIARELAISGREVIVLEAETDKGQHASSRNTGVIHAGIGYGQKTFKSRLCLEGKARLYRYCAERNIPHKKVGKLLIADPANGQTAVDNLKALQDKAHRQGLSDLHFLTADDVRGIEPQLVCSAALWSPSSGIIDVHAYMDALQGDIQDHRGFIAFGSPVEAGRMESDRIYIDIADRHHTKLACSIMVNAAGLNAPLVAARIADRKGDAIPPRLLSRGLYAVLRRSSPFSHLIYPAAHGVHVSLDLGGQMRVGPDAEWIDSIDYSFDERRIESFYDQIRAFWPGIRDGDLAPGWAGIRARIGTGSTKDVDFRIDSTNASGSCLIDLFGIDSPGLTASLAIAAEVEGLVRRYNK